MRSNVMISHRAWQLAVGPFMDRSGASAVIIALALSIIIGFAGLGTEVASWYLIKRSMQGAVDTAAATAAAELAASSSATSAQMTSAAKSIAATYGFVDGTASTTVAVNNPPATTTGLANCSSPFAGFNCYVEVIVTQPQTPRSRRSSCPRDRQSKPELSRLPTPQRPPMVASSRLARRPMPST
jgi:Flp pilus assembly protein TadG